ncbi:MAG: plasmid partitioning protein RepB [Beijerinckiaceae bacterium]
MARKNLLAGLTGQELPAGNSAEEVPSESLNSPSATRRFGLSGSRGAIGAVSRSFEQLKAQSVVELATDVIDDSLVSDRLKGSPESHNELVGSIYEHGQQVPILVRPHPHREGRYQIAYGRRRLRACAELGRPVRAVVKTLNDNELVVAQGQENSAREDLSFIEKALFAARLAENHYSRETIMAALSVDKTGLSRLISSAVKIPREIIEAIGPAPKTGRDRWIELSTRLDRPAALTMARRFITEEAFSAKPSDVRFGELFEAVAPKKPKPTRPVVWKSEDGARVALIKDDEKSLTLTIDKKAASEFAAYLVESLPEVYAAFKRRAEA